MQSRPAAVVLILAFLIALGGVARAQTISGIIAGTVVDDRGKPLPSVGIRAINPQSGRVYPASSSSQGYFRILEVPPGVYTVEAVSPGYRRERHTAVRVDVNRTTIEDFGLQVQTTEEKPRELASAAPMTSTDSPTLSTAFPQKEIAELPILTRDVNNLALLAPGVLSVRTFSFASTLVPFAVNGSRGRDNNFIIDSVDNNEPLFGGAASQFTNTDIFSEYAILTNQLKAEFGRNSGATINAITRSGSNDLHGTAFWYGQDDTFNAMTAVEKAALLKSPARFYENQLGATLGGALKKDKTFYFLSYQWDRARDNLSDVFPVLATLPTGAAGPNPGGLAALQGLTFTNPQPINALLGLQTLKVVPNQAAPCFRSPVPASFGFSTTNPCDLNPLVNISINGTAIPFNVYRVKNGNIFDVRDHQLSGRLDHRINNVNDIYARYLFDDLVAPRFPVANAGQAAFSDTGLFPDWRLLNEQRTQSTLLNHRYYRVNSLNELRFSYSRVSQGVGAFNLPANVREHQAAAIINDQFDASGITIKSGPFSDVFPSAGTSIALGLDSRPTKITSNTYQIQDNFSLTKGRHSIKFGGNFVRIESNIRSTPSDLGNYIFQNKRPPGAFVPVPGLQNFLSEPLTGGINLFPANPAPANMFVLGEPSTNAVVVSQRFANVITNGTNQAGNIIGQGRDAVMLREYDEFMFAQDDWRIRKNLTISAGLRYEIFGQPINSIRKFNPAGPHVNKDYKDFGPRLGFAWSPWKNVVFRGGYAIQYNPTVLNIPLLIWQSGPISPLFTFDAFAFNNIVPNPNAPNPTAPPGTVGSPCPAPSPFNPLGCNLEAQPSGVWPNQPFTLRDVNLGVAGCSRFADLFNITPLGSRVLQGTIPLINCSDQETVDPHLKNPYIQNFSFNVQYQLAANWLLEVGYVGSKGTRLFQRVDKNPFAGWNTACVQAFAPAPPLNLGFVPQQCRNSRLDDAHGNITQTTNGGSSSYQSLQISVTKRLSHIPRFGDLTLNAGYSWSHMIDNASEIFGPGFRFFQISGASSSKIKQNGIADFLLNPLSASPVESITPFSQVFNQTTRAERGNSSFDRRHRFSADFLWEPFPNRGAFLRGWQLNGVVSVQTGQSFTPLNASPESACADSNGDGLVGNDRPDIGNPRLPLNTVALLADPACLNPALGYVDLKGNPITPANAHFVQRPLQASAGAAGSAGRNTLLGPRLANLDLSVYKIVKFREHYQLQFRWEVYDVFNHPNFGNAIGNAFATDAQPTPAFAFSTTRTAAAISGVIPENALDAFSSTRFVGTQPLRSFLSKDTMNTSNRRMQFGIRFVF